MEDQSAERQAETENTHAVVRAASVEQASRQRQRQALELQRERILDERTSSPHRRAALEAALADVEARLALIL